jgi:hypothetical protein
MGLTPTPDDESQFKQTSPVFFQYVAGVLETAVQLHPIRLYWYMNKVKLHVNALPDIMKNSHKKWVENLINKNPQISSRLKSTFRELIHWNFLKSLNC